MLLTETRTLTFFTDEDIYSYTENDLKELLAKNDIPVEKVIEINIDSPKK